MGIINIILRRKSVAKLRKTYDKLREKADKEESINRRITILHFLDRIEAWIVQLEEGITPDFEKRRMIKYIDRNLKKAKIMIKDKDYLKPMIKESKK